MNNPKVSIILPIYNSENYLSKTLNSILWQTYTNYELIIVNDASTDQTQEIIDTYQKQYPDKIKSFTFTQKLGFLGEKAANFAIKKAQGKYIAKVDADDLMHPERIAKQVTFLEKNSEIFLVGSAVFIIDENGKLRGKIDPPLSHQKIKDTFYLRNPIIHPSIMFRNPKNDRDFYDLRFKYFSDYYTFYKLIYQGKKLANLADYLLFYRIHSQNNTFAKIKQTYKIDYEIKKIFVNEFGLHPKLTQKIYLGLKYLVLTLFSEKLIKNIYSFWFFTLNKI